MQKSLIPQFLSELLTFSPQQQTYQRVNGVLKFPL